MGSPTRPNRSLELTSFGKPQSAAQLQRYAPLKFTVTGSSTLKNRNFVVEQYRAGKLVRVFAPSGDEGRPWQMSTNGRTYLRTNGWVLSKILPTLVEGSLISTRVVAAGSPVATDKTLASNNSFKR